MSKDNNNSNNKKSKPRPPKEGANPKKFKKKTSILLTDKIEYVDYKDVNLLTRFVSDRSKIRNRRVTGNTVQQQRDIANAIKNSREMALIPYTKRVSQTRTSRPPRDGDGRRGRDDDQSREPQGAAAAAQRAESSSEAVAEPSNEAVAGDTTFEATEVEG